MLRDAEIRDSLVGRLSKAHFDDPEASLINELVLTQHARADVVVLNGRIEGFEIKSDADTLTRLQHQMPAYELVCDRVWLVTVEKFYDDALAILPPWWGVMIATESQSGVRLTRKRHARKHPQQDVFAMLKLLWKQEVIELGNSHNLCFKTRDTGDDMRKALGAVITRQQASDAVRKYLSRRDLWRTVALSG